MTNVILVVSLHGIDETLGHLGGWDVRKIPLTATDRGRRARHRRAGFATLRTNLVTGQPEAPSVVPGGYTPLQNEDHADS